ncbi:hypothetical protein C1N80_06240 [Brachybacterium sp. SGAir0954]|uniref:hypothetical protein n=1 Tax=Brachybacterium sp. SGAir0954 TaxID=2571029 RepID=UPI0010CD69B1|nr:hypothetical protein [Brachybacterium sp. SGAir0954]QCR53219.1 hypothetical protein C1N80_06240 [Brachybacterium sp. SGAir0954]
MTTFEQIGTMRDRLENIRQWRGQLSDVMLTITGYSMDLTGIRGTTDRIPGGDALAMLAPWAPDATHGDDLPHPDQVIKEWSHTIHDHHGTVPPARATWAEHWRYLWDETQRILESPWAEAWTADITALWWRLARLTGNAPAPEPEPLRSVDDVWAALEQNPEHELTRRDLTHLGINPSTLTTWRHRGKISESTPGRYRAGDILDARRTA